jgi:hypothetical protein
MCQMLPEIKSILNELEKEHNKKNAKQRNEGVNTNVEKKLSKEKDAKNN